MVYEGKSKRKARKGTYGGQLKFGAAIWIIFLALLVRFGFPEQSKDFFQKLGKTLGGNVQYEEAVRAMGRAVSGEENFGSAVRKAFTYAFMTEDEPIETFSEELSYEAEDDLQQGDNPPAPEGTTEEYVELQIKYAPPVSGAVIVPFGYYMDEDMTLKFNYGTDIKTPTEEPVNAFADGKVYAVGSSAVYGEYVIVIHDGAKTLYSNLSNIKVRSGDQVLLGQEIGQTSGDILHFELMIGDNYVDPSYYLKNED